MAESKRLKTHVHVIQEDGSSTVYGPDDDVPTKDAKKIGAHAWAGADEGQTDDGTAPAEPAAS